MEIKVYGQVIKERYIIDWDWEDNDWEDILNNTEKYIKVKTHAIDYREIPQSMIGNKGVYRIMNSEFDMEKGFIIHYSDFVIETVEAEKEERIEEIEYAKEQCRIRLARNRKEDAGKTLNTTDQKKWYQF